ncbi:hypothetical protein [Conexibacter sp. W3-3-2]|uniref:hypothetical protein n=1 Tax=Conexibacter sp. W3-3-2 TaxID=2675227 RepID=UPI001E611ECB|nr:hypothetical protein [Conexibacter sp. W3-3-2]
MAAHAALHLTAHPADQQTQRLTQLTAELTQRAHARTLLRTAASWPTDLTLPTPDQLLNTDPTDPDEHRRLALELCLSLATPDHDPAPDTHALTDARDRTAHALHTPPAPPRTRPPAPADPRPHRPPRPPHLRPPQRPAPARAP